MNSQTNHCYNTTESLLHQTLDSVLRLLAGVALLVAGCASLFPAELRIGQVTVPPGVPVSLPLTHDGAPNPVAAQLDVSFDPSFVALIGASAGDGLAGHIVDHEQLAPGHQRILVYSTTNGPITPGTMVWLSFSVSADVPSGVIPLRLTNAIVAAAAGNRVEPVAQLDGAIIVSSGERFTSVTLTSDGQLHMQFQGAEDRQYLFEASTNLTDWLALSTNQVVGGIVSLIETNTAAYPQRFYRARLLP